MRPDLSRCLLYGASGYTGELIAELAFERGQRLVLAGRSKEKLAPLAERLGAPVRVFGLDDPTAIDRNLADIDVVIHAAGPFSRTSKPMVDACIRRRVHYLDITGEIDVFEACARRDEEARAAGVMLMPGTGFDVVPSDCLAAHLARRSPDATHLTLAIGLGGRSSHGTTTTMVENLHRPNFVRRDGELTAVRTGKLRRKFDFGRGARTALGIPWGDVSTAYYSTKIPNIDVYMTVPTGAAIAAAVLGYLGPLATRPVQRLMRSRISEGGPSAEERRRSHNVLIGRVRRGEEELATRLRVPDGYTLTSWTALAIAERVLDGAAVPGFQTPAMVFGPDFILEFEGVERRDEA